MIYAIAERDVPPPGLVIVIDAADLAQLRERPMGLQMQPSEPMMPPLLLLLAEDEEDSKEKLRRLFRTVEERGTIKREIVAEGEGPLPAVLTAQGKPNDPPRKGDVVVCIAPQVHGTLGIVTAVGDGRLSALLGNGLAVEHSWEHFLPINLPGSKATVNFAEAMK